MLLAFETSCDETSAALVHHGTVLANCVSSQVALHAEYGGVVPELAAREQLRGLLPVARMALGEAGISVDQLEAIAATQGPGLPTALLVGLRAAQTAAFVLRLPFIGVNHHEAHLYSPWLSGAPPRFAGEQFEPNVSLIVSGGHTLLVHVSGLLEHKVLGSTVDDAAGECFDKVGKLLGLPYPAGPVIDRLAQRGNPKAHEFPRPMLSESHDDFSFSGLKTSVRYFLRDHPNLADTTESLCDLCASVQEAIVTVLARKTVRAAKRLRVRTVTASGGVTANRALRSRLEQECQAAGLRLLLAQSSLCTDNAAMVAALAELKLARLPAGTSLDADIEPGWALN